MTEYLPPRIINEITYYPEIGTVSEVLDGFESHGIPAWNIYFRFGNVGQGTGNRRSDTYTGKSDIEAILQAMGVSSLKELEGQLAIALHRGGAAGPIAGIASFDNPNLFAIFHH